MNETGAHADAGNQKAEIKMLVDSFHGGK